MTECTKTWKHVGPGFRPSKTAYGKCPNRKSRTKIRAFLPGSGGGKVTPVATLLRNGDDDGGDDDCNEGMLYQQLEKPAYTNRYSDKGSIPDEVVTTYCKLDRSPYQTQFVEHLGSSDEQEAQTWEDVIEKPGINTPMVKKTIKYLLRDGWDSDGQPLVDEHDVERFVTGKTANALDANAMNAHRQPGIVTEIETGEEMALARIYSASGGIAGGYLAWPEDVAGNDWKELIRDFALLDPEAVKDTAVQPTWNHYECVGKVFVPEDTKMSVDYTDRFDGNFIDTSVIESGVMEGDTARFALHHHFGSSGNIDSEKWVPLGTIKEVGSDAGEFRTKWRKADDTGMSLANGKCDV